MIVDCFNTDEQVLVIAEIGNNHEGNFDVAQELVRKAAESGVDAVKFQTFKTGLFGNPADPDRYERLKSFELSFSEFERLSELARSLGLLFISTPLDLASATFLERIVDCYKIASGDNDFYPLIGQVARTGKPLIVSTGLSDARQVSKTVEFVKGVWGGHTIDRQLGVLHCVSSYPVLPEQVNLRSIPFLAENFDCTVGYSDHTLGIEAPVLAVALGARVVEKHFTLDKAFSDFRDHQMSADPADMEELVRRVRLASSMLGEVRKTIQPCEEEAVVALRRSIVAGRDLPGGHPVSESDLMWIRPADGLAPGEEHVLIDKVLTHSVPFAEPVTASDVA